MKKYVIIKTTTLFYDEHGEGNFGGDVLSNEYNKILEVL